MEAFLQDVRYGLRMYGKNPGFTLLATVTLALGIGAATVMFSVIEGAVLNPFPYKDGHHLAVLVAKYPDYSPDFQWASPSVPEFLDYRKQLHAFDAIIGGRPEYIVMTGGEAPVSMDAWKLTGNMMQVLGVPPLMGRIFTPADAEPGAPPVVVLSYKAWQGKFGGDPKILGRTLVLNRQPTTVIGVMPPRFCWGAADIDMWLPVDFSAASDASQPQYVLLVGHLRPGVSLKQAAAEVAVLSKGFAALYPKDHPKGVSFSVQNLADAAVGPEPHRIFYVLLGAVGLLFGIACVNVANLLLARGTSRETEIAIRASLGAGRLRLVRQFMVESLMLALGGALLGCFFAWAGLKGVVALIPSWDIPAESDIHINGTVLLFMVVAALLGMLVFGLVPALHAVRRDLQTDLRSGGRGAGESRSHIRLRNLLVVSEVTLSLVLLSGAGMLIRSFFAIRHVELGYDPSNVLSAYFMLPESRYKTIEQRNEFSIEALRRVRALPGVVSAVFAAPPPVWGGWITGIEITGKPSQENWRVRMHAASDGYFSTLRIPMLQGRSISEADYAHASKVAVINRSFVKKYFAGENPLGRQVTVKELADPPLSVKSPTFEIVGVAADIRDTGPEDPSEPGMYIPYTVVGYRWDSLLVRTAQAPGSLLNPVRLQLATLDKELPLEGRSLAEILNESWFVNPRFELILMSIFASLGLTLVLIGVYSVLSYSVTRRTHEIGVRMALGAGATDVRRMLLKSGLRWLLVGIGLGVPASIALAKILQNRIWGIKSADPLTLVAVSLLLTLVGLAACYIPARRATKVDPMVALRYE
jgi:putative ABC transport system permease protein